MLTGGKLRSQLVTKTTHYACVDMDGRRRSQNWLVTFGGLIAGLIGEECGPQEPKDALPGGAWPLA